MKLVIAGLLAILSLGPNVAAACGYSTCWGAVGIAPNGAYGFSTSYATEDAALNRMFSECPNCDTWYTFFNACGAIARASDGAWGSGWGTSRQLAESYATQTCNTHTRSGGCRTSVWACSF
jgi:hypothetical protein